MCRSALVAIVCLLVLLSLPAGSPGSLAQPMPPASLAPGNDVWTSDGPYGGYVTTMARAPSAADLLYAGTRSGLYKSLDGGATWIETPFPQIEVRSLQVAPHDPGVVYAGTSDGIYRTGDGGATWSPKGFAGKKVDALAIDPGDPQVLYAGANQFGDTVGVFKSSDGGDSWQPRLTSGLTYASALLIDTDNPSYVYAGTHSSGVSRVYFHWSPDGGTTWHGVGFSGTSNYGGVALAMTPAGTQPRTLYLTLSSCDVLKSTDRGQTWEPAHLPWISPSPPWALAVDPNHPRTVYAGTWYYKGNVYRSTDGGDTWQVKANGLPPGGPSSILIDPQQGTLLAGLSERGIYRSTDGAETWEPANQGLRNTYIQGLAVHPWSPDIVFAGIRGDGYALAATGDGGASWDEAHSPAAANLGAVAFDRQNPPNLWVGDGLDYLYRVNVYRSPDLGQTWTHSWFNYCFESPPCHTGAFDILINPGDPEGVVVAAGSLEGVLVRRSASQPGWLLIGGPSNALAADPGQPGVVYSGKQGPGQVFRYGDMWVHLDVNEISPPGGIGDVRDIEVGADGRVYVAASNGLWRWNGSGWSTLSGLPMGDLTALAIDRSRQPEVLYAGSSACGVYRSEDGGSTWLPFNEGLGRLAITRLAISSGPPRVLYAGTAYGGVWRHALGGMRPIYLPLLVRDS